MRNFILFLLMSISFSNYGQGTLDQFFHRSNTFFQAHVKEGRVDYENIKRNTTELKEILNLAKEVRVGVENPKEYKSFWINTYNLLVIAGIVENYPVKSPLDINGFFDETIHEVGGEKRTLNEIENVLLRAKFPNEPRFHFVLVCAGLGCPPIISNAYTPKNLEQQLQKQTERALNDEAFIRVNKNKVKISQIFEWYTEDFTRDGQTLQGFIDNYRTEKLPENAKLSYYPYDWTLNKAN